MGTGRDDDVTLPTIVGEKAVVSNVHCGKKITADSSSRDSWIIVLCLVLTLGGARGTSGRVHGLSCAMVTIQGNGGQGAWGGWGGQELARPQAVHLVHTQFCARRGYLRWCEYPRLNLLYKQ